MSRKGLSRRTVLRGMGGTAIALPFLDAMIGVGRRAHAQSTKFPKRFLVWYTPNGTVPANFWPYGVDGDSQGNAETDFPMSPILKPLEDHRDDLLILKGVDMASSRKGPGDAHQKGTGSCLTGTPLQDGDFAGDGGASAGWADGVSIDQYIADQVGKETQFQSLEFGVAVQGSTVRSRISYRGPAQPLPPENSPYAMYNRLFGDPSVTPEELARRNERRKAVLDAVAGEYGKLRQRLGTADRDKLEVHLNAVGDLRARLDKAAIDLSGACARPTLDDAIDHERVSNMPAIGTLQIDLLAMALACDLTRVASLMWSQSTAPHLYSWLGDDIREGHHSLAHKSDGDKPKVEQNTRINQWYCEQFAYLIKKLKEIPEGDGSVFDNTVIFWTNEQARGNNHDRNDMPYVLAGSAGGYFKMGRYIEQSSSVPHNKLLVSLTNAMDIEGDSFGDPEFGTGALAGLT